MRCDYETPFVKFLLGTPEASAIVEPRCSPARRRTLVSLTLIHNFYNLLTFRGLLAAARLRSPTIAL